MLVFELVTSSILARPTEQLPSSCTVPQLGENGSLKKSKSELDMRKSFWSRLKRNKGAGGETPPRYDCVSSPSPAMPGSNLIWSPDQQIWLFPNEHSRLDKQPHRAEHPPHPVSSNGCSGDLFGQIPGHYHSSPYDKNTDQDSPSYTCCESSNNVVRRSGTESQWTLVARRVSEPASPR